ncbi:MAG: 16S rRNA (cytosine(967)-C(5))-methyltransferase RsmB [Gammaproteobacteria bacterium]
MSVRATAAHLVGAVVDGGQSLNAILPAALLALADQERALTQELCYGVLRFYPRLEHIAAGLLHKALKRKDRDVHQLILVGLYQLIYLKMPAHAAVAETVAAARALGKDWAANLVNALLRSFQRAPDQYLTRADADLTARWAHPHWWITGLQSEWPDHWQDIVAANNQRPPMTLRVNTQRVSRDSYQSTLQDAGLVAQPHAYAPSALTLEQPVDVARLPGFAAGQVSVQDAAAQLAAGLLDLAPDQRVLDACAAPGGKSAHLLESVPRLRLLALDSEAQRLTRLHDTLRRLELQAEVCIGDAGAPRDWWDGELFDRILLDAPCSGSGVIRRHPDIKLLRTPTDIAALARLQRHLLDALWPLLAPGGILLYATCSVLPEENRRNVAAFLADHEDAGEHRIEAAWGHEQPPGRQILPGESGMDGFYYARLVKH